MPPVTPPEDFDPLYEIGEADAPPKRRLAKVDDGAAVRQPTTKAQARRSAKKWAPLVTIAAVLLGIIAIQTLNAEPAASPEMPSDHPDVSMGDGSTAPAVDTEAVLAQMAVLATDPTNTTAMQALADLHAEAEDFKTAAQWLRKIVEIEPDNASAYLQLGVSLFNAYDTDGAKAGWLRAAEIDPMRAEAYYNLGFLFLSLKTPDEAAAFAAWEKVLEIAPDSDMAATVSSHIGALDPAKGGTDE